MKVTTETGSVYEITDTHVRRIGTHTMRRDGDWLAYTNILPIQIGSPVTFVLEPLGEGDVTVRTTSRVTAVEGEDR